MRKIQKIFAIVLLTVLFFNVIPNQKVNAVTIADQVEGEVVFNEYDSFKLKYNEPTVLKIVLPEDGTFKLDFKPGSISGLCAYIFDELGNELYYDDDKFFSTNEISPLFFRCDSDFKAGIYYLKIWSSDSDYKGGVDVTYYGGFTPSKRQDIDICLKLKVRKTIQLGTIISNSSKKKVTWKSSKPSVAKISSSGKIKGIKKGTATIKAYTDDGLVTKIVVKVSK